MAPRTRSGAFEPEPPPPGAVAPPRPGLPEPGGNGFETEAYVDHLGVIRNHGTEPELPAGHVQVRWIGPADRSLHLTGVPAKDHYLDAEAAAALVKASPQLYQFADGGVFTAPTGAVLADKPSGGELIVPLSEPEPASP